MDIYIDESGSIHKTNEKLNKYFIIGMVIPENKDKLKSVFKYFISKNLKELQKIDKNNKMFDKTGKFIELKGCCFNKRMKQDFLEYFCKNNLFKVTYIILNNDEINEKFILNKARTFNYLIKIFLINLLNKKECNTKDIFLHIDERNVKTNSKYSLEDYLNQELILNEDLIKSIQVKYYDSCNNILIQIADVFSNIMYSNIITKGGYENILTSLYSQGYILKPFIFPKNKFKKF